jgi:hypothetical protein
MPTVNKIAIRALCRMLDVLAEQMSEVAYAHSQMPGTGDTDDVLRQVARTLRAAREEINAHLEALD